MSIICKISSVHSGENNKSVIMYVILLKFTYTLNPIWNVVGDMNPEIITAALHGASLGLVASDDWYLSTCWTLGCFCLEILLNTVFAEPVVTFVEVLGIGVRTLTDAACVTGVIRCVCGLSWDYASFCSCMLSCWWWWNGTELCFLFLKRTIVKVQCQRLEGSHHICVIHDPCS